MENKRKIRLFEIIDKMNHNDTLNNTNDLGVGLDLVSANYQKSKNGTIIQIGFPGNVVNDIMDDKFRPMLVMLPMGLYRSMESEQVIDSYGVDQISSERSKQIDKHGFTAKWQAEHPEYYKAGQLVEAARMLTMWTDAESKIHTIPRPFGWDKEWFTKLMLKPFEDRIRIAGALLAAELDRLKYLSDNKTGSDER